MRYTTARSGVGVPNTNNNPTASRHNFQTETNEAPKRNNYETKTTKVNQSKRPSMMNTTRRKTSKSTKAPDFMSMLSDVNVDTETDADIDLDDSGFYEDDFYPAIDDDLSLHRDMRRRAAVSRDSAECSKKTERTSSNNTTTNNDTNNTASNLSTSSLSSSASDTGSDDDDGYTSDSDESLETSILYLVEKQALLKRFSAQLRQEELYSASMARADIALKQEEEQQSLSSGSSANASFPFSEEDEDFDLVDPEDLGNGNIWIKAKKILRSLSKQRGIMYHASSSVSIPASKTKKGAKKRQRRVRFDPETKPSPVVDQVGQGMQERRAKCARIDKTSVKLMLATNFKVQSDLACVSPEEDSQAAFNPCMKNDLLMTTLQSCLSETSATAFSMYNNKRMVPAKGA